MITVPHRFRSSRSTNGSSSRGGANEMWHRDHRPLHCRSAAESNVQSRQDEQADQCRREETSDDDEGHGTDDLQAGDLACDPERQQYQRRGEGRYEDRRQTLLRPAYHELWVEGLAFAWLEGLTAPDQDA